MDSNGNQRKRCGRVPKNVNSIERSSPRSSENNEVMEVSVVAISPTLEESGTVNNNAPPSECRRSSRKKIIKFDVRDLLNKHRKTHKIQIEARIDSNAPTTSKASTAGCTTTSISKTSTTSREDLISQHKTFLEKSAIFRRYSVSQEHKAPPPLPIPPLIGKTSNSKDCGFAGTSSSHEFLNHAMIKPRQPTSLIVAQIESNTPSSSGSAKRKSLSNPLDIETKVTNCSEVSAVTQQKKRGRPAKVKTISPKNDSIKIKTPEKAKNWKEYKACLAQQSSEKDEKQENLTVEQTDKANILNKYETKNVDDTLQSDISRSDDDGNFSGFHSSKDDTSCDSPLLSKLYSYKESSNKSDSFSKALVLEESETKDSSYSNEGKTICKTRQKTYRNKKVSLSPTTEQNTVEKSTDPEQDASHNKGLNLKSLKEIEAKNISVMEQQCIDEKNNTIEKLRHTKNDASSSGIKNKKEIDIDLGSSETTTRKELTSVEETSCLKSDESQHFKNSSEVSQAIKITDMAPTQHQKDIDPTESNLVNAEKIDNKTEKLQEQVQVTLLKSEKLPEESDVQNSTKKKPLPQSITSLDRAKLFSRSSSSSESENASERSSYSSSCASSTRSSNRGNKLENSIKGISLQKIQSTSPSQPIMAKRSKRLQKKYNKERFDSVAVSKNIDSSCNEICNVVSQAELSINTEVSSKDIPSSVSENKAEISSAVESPDMAQKLVTQSITKDITQGSDENFSTPATLTQESSEKKCFSDKENLSKCLLDSLENFCSGKEQQQTEQQKSKDKQKPLEKGFDQTPKAPEEYKQEEVLEKKETEEHLKHAEISESHQGGMDRKKYRKVLPAAQFVQKEHEKEKENGSNTEKKSKDLVSTKKTKIQSENSATDEMKKSVYTEAKKKEDCINATDTSESVSNKNISPQSTEVVTNNTIVNEDKPAITQTSNEVKCSSVTTSLSNEFKSETQGKALLASTKPTKVVPSTESKPKKEVLIKETKKSHQKLIKCDEKISLQNLKLETSKSNTDKTKNSKQLGTREIAADTNKSSTHIVCRTDKNINVSSNTNKTYEEEAASTNSKLHAKKHLSGGAKEGHSSPSSTKKFSSEKRKQFKISESGKAKSKNLVASPVKVDKLENDIKLISPRIKTSKKSDIELSEKDKGAKAPTTKCKNHNTTFKISEKAELRKSSNKILSTHSSSSSETIATKRTENIAVTMESTSKRVEKEISAVQLSKECLYQMHSELTTENTLQKDVLAAAADLYKFVNKESFAVGNQITKTNDNKDTEKLLKSTLAVRDTENTTKKLADTEAGTKETAKENFASPKRKDKDVNKTSDAPKGSERKKSTHSPDLSTTSTVDINELITETLTFGSCGNPFSKTNDKNEKTLQEQNLIIESVANKQFAAVKDINDLKPTTILSETSASAPIMHTDSTEATTLSYSSHETSKAHDVAELLLETPNTQEKPPLQHDKSKRCGRRQRFRNLHVSDVDSETDSSNGKSTPIDEISYQKLKTNQVSTQKEKLEEKKVQDEQTYSEVVTSICKSKNNDVEIIDKEESACLQESGQTNLSSSQIKNVSIETNTLLDILRTVQSNTEAALKANRSPINVDEDQEQLKLTSATLLGNESPSTDRKFNLSPTSSDSASPSTLKRLPSSPARSNSLSPLTLKKVTRRYERRSRLAEDSAHKTLEETFAEIAAQSSKAVLAAKEFDINQEQEKNEESIDIEKEQLKDTCTEFSKLSGLADMTTETNETFDEPEKKVVEDVDQTLDVLTEVETISTDNVVTAEIMKMSPAISDDSPKGNEEDTCNKVDVAKEITIRSETEVINVENNSEKSENTSEIILTPDLSMNECTTSLPVLSCPIEQLNVSQALIEESLKQLKNPSESKTDKKLAKDYEFVSESDALPPNNEACQEKEDELQTPNKLIKKRDSSLTKSETKSTGKKQAKKTKTDEEDISILPREETLTKAVASTPPPSKRGRKPKSQQQDTPPNSSKKNNKKDACSKTDEEENNEESVKHFESESESFNTSSDKSLDERLAKKNRQIKLKEAFEAALIDDKEKSMKGLQSGNCSPISSSSCGLELLNKSPSPEKNQAISNEEVNETTKINCITPVEPEDLDPLKDIEKFIADGVNLLKKDYKLDEDSVDDVIETAPSKPIIREEESNNTIINEAKPIFSTFETPIDTPLNTPSVTPPPKSPTSVESTTPDEISGVRRSHRIKLITKTPKALVGRGLVRDRERFSIKDDVETKSHYTMDDHLTDLAEVEAKNAKFLKEMEERLSNFQVIKENDYLCERVISREARKMICDCFLTHEEEGRGELGCGEDCLNRLLMIECGLECNVKERCTNRRFQKLLCSPCRVFRTEKKGFGIMADVEILPGEFIMEYVGEVIDTDEFEKRRVMYSLDKNRHYYFMALRSDAIIDATIKGNISRFINHSCDPNAETQKWTVNGELRIGFFSRKSIMPGEEITFNYQYQRYGREAQRCYCESTNCRGWIGQEPTSDEGEQMDDEDDESEDEEEEADTSNLLVQDDDEDSDASVADPEEVQKQLEMAAAQAEVELAPLQILEREGKQVQDAAGEGKSSSDSNKVENEEDSKSKFKKLLSKMAEKVAAKQKQTKRELKLQRKKKKSKESSTELTNKLKFSEDPDIEDEVEFLKECGLKNQSDTLRLSRLMVRAKLAQTRLNLLEILRKGDFPCRRLFLDYHGLRLLHGWMSEDAGNMQIRLSLLQTLETLPIANKTILTDSKVMQGVRNWCGTNTNLSPNEDSSSSNSNSQEAQVQHSTSFEEGSEMAELQKLALKLITTWDGLPEIFRIPKKERIEQMKEHEREADRQYAANVETHSNSTTTDRYRRDRFGRSVHTLNNTSNTNNRFIKPNNGNSHKTSNATKENLKNLSKTQRREMFAAKVARDEAEKRLAEERREFETKCRFFGLDPKKTRGQDIPFCVNPSTGQWYSIERKPITTPPSYAHVQVPIKPKSTDPNDYQLPAVCNSLPCQWKFAITPQGKIYYYHIKHRIPQWEPPSPGQIQQCELESREDDSESEITTAAGEDSSDDDDEILIGMDAVQLKSYIERKVEMRRQKRYQRLVDERPISPRREEDRIYNQIEVRKYKENKEKIRKRKEDIRRKRAEAIRQTSLNIGTLGSTTDTKSNTGKTETEDDENSGSLPIQDYLLSSDEEIDIKAEVNSPLIDKIVEGDKIVDELDALTKKRQLKRPLPPHRDLNELLTSSSAASNLAASIPVAKQEYKKRKMEKKEKRKPKDQDAKYRKNKEKFRCEIAGIIVHHLKPYIKETCTSARIQSNEDFNHLARKLTHFVMIKELKYCESVGQTLVVTESVKSKSREFIKKYMAKYGDVYIKPTNDPDFKDIPFTL